MKHLFHENTVDFFNFSTRGTVKFIKINDISILTQKIKETAK